MQNKFRMDIVAIIPARGGSKSIPLKNIYPLNGKPLLAYTIEAVKKASVAKEIYVSTDSKEIAKVARDFGALVIKRPKKISTDFASTESALIQAIETIKREKSWIPDAVLTLPPTSPLRSAKTIRDFVSFFLIVSERYDSMVSFTETKGDYWFKDKKGNFKRLFPDAPRRRQDRDPLYLENSAIYITKTKSLLKTKSILGNRCTGFIINELESIDINNPIDLKWAEFIHKNILVDKKKE